MGVWCWGEVRGVCRGEGIRVDSMQESYGAGSAHSSTASLLTRKGVSDREDGSDFST